MNRTLAAILVFGFVLTGALGFSDAHGDCAATLSRGFTCQNFGLSLLIALLIGVGFLAGSASSSSFLVGGFFSRHNLYPVKPELLSWLSLHEASPSAF